jgi:SH3-like domain-containing protein
MEKKHYLPAISFLAIITAVVLLPILSAAGEEMTSIRVVECFECGAYVADTDPRGVNVRSGPGVDYPVVKTFSYHEGVSLSGSAGEWVRIGITGTTDPWWVYGPGLAVTAWTRPDSGFFNWQDPSGLVPILGDPPYDSGVVAWVPQNTELTVIGCGGGDIKVRYKGVEGWLRYHEHVTDPLSTPPGGIKKTRMEVIPCDNVAAYVVDDDPKGVNLRFGPGTGYPSIVTLPTDRPVQVRIAGALNNWALIKSAVFRSEEDGEMTMEVTGWVKAPLLGVRAENAEDFAGAVSLYKDANAESGVVAEVPGDTGVTILAARGGWLKVKYEKQEGWLAPDAQCGDPFKECH